MTDYQKYINALRKCAKEHKYDVTPFAHVRVSDLCHDVADLLERLAQEPCEDAISRTDMLDAIGHGTTYTSEDLQKIIKGLPPVNPQPKTEQFAKWVAREIFDEDWEYNKDAFAELACRKLAKLGIVRANGDEWELVDLQESEDKCKNCEYYRNPDYTRCHECNAESEG